MAFDVKFSEVQDLQNDFTKFSQALFAADSAVCKSAESVAGLSSFQGTGASNIKLYYQEVHRGISVLVDTLTQQLATQYAKEYYSKFSEGWVSEQDNDAEWSSATMAEAERVLEGLKNGQVESANEWLKRAMDAVPDEYAGVFAMPSPDPLNNTLSGQGNRIRMTREGVQAAEDSGVAAFSGKSDAFERLANAVRMAINKCANGGAAIASGGDFWSIVGLDAYDAFNRCSRYQADNQQVTIEAQKDSINRETMRIEEQKRKEAESKRFWATVGTVASMLVLVGAAAATVASFGTAAPLSVTVLSSSVNVLGTAFALKDSVDRADELGKLYAGDDGFDREKLGKEIKAGKDITKTGLKFASKMEEGDYENYLSDKALNDGLKNSKEAFAEADEHFNKANKAYSDAGLGVGRFIGEQVLDARIDGIQDERKKAGLKADKEGWFAVWDSVKAHMKGDDLSAEAGAIGGVGKIGTIYADYHEEQADRKIEVYQQQQNDLADLKKNLGKRMNGSFIPVPTKLNGEPM